MSELTLLDLNNSKDLVEELNLQESKLIIGGHDRDHPDGGRGYERDSEKEKDNDDSTLIYKSDDERPDKLCVYGCGEESGGS